MKKRSEVSRAVARDIPDRTAGLLPVGPTRPFDPRPAIARSTFNSGRPIKVIAEKDLANGGRTEGRQSISGARPVKSGRAKDFSQKLLVKRLRGAKS
jgi:hypothetical protein